MDFLSVKCCSFFSSQCIATSSRSSTIMFAQSHLHVVTVRWCEGHRVRIELDWKTLLGPEHNTFGRTLHYCAHYWKQHNLQFTAWNLVPPEPWPKSKKAWFENRYVQVVHVYGNYNSGEKAQKNEVKGIPRGFEPPNQDSDVSLVCLKCIELNLDWTW